MKIGISIESERLWEALEIPMGKKMDFAKFEFKLIRWAPRCLGRVYCNTCCTVGRALMIMYGHCW